jgi:hypothetical protein
MDTEKAHSKFCCKHCRAELGTMDGLRLIVVTVILSSRTPLRCVLCQKVTVWYPVGKMTQKPIASEIACANL